MFVTTQYVNQEKTLKSTCFKYNFNADNDSPKLFEFICNLYVLVSCFLVLKCCKLLTSIQNMLFWEPQGYKIFITFNSTDYN